jgi:uncharacterized protein (TIGR03086 family)
MNSGGLGRQSRHEAGRAKTRADVTEISERYRNVAAQMTARVTAVPAEAWDNPSPCEGWAARDVIDHLVGWISAFPLGTVGIGIAAPSVREDVVGAWEVLDRAIQAALDDPHTATRELDSPMGRVTLEQAIDMFCTADVLVHTWDLARATGLDETLDVEDVHRLLVAMEPMDDILRASGQYGPRVAVTPDADEQTRLIAFTGRRP